MGRGLWMSLSLLLLSSCGKPADDLGSGSGSPCDLDALRQLSAKLGPMSRFDGARTVWPGVRSACGDDIPKAAGWYFDRLSDPENRDRPIAGIDEELGKMQVAACPDWDAVSRELALTPASLRGEFVFRACQFGRYGVVDDSEFGPATGGLLPFAMHQWLLDQGLDAAVAAPITDALYALDRLNEGGVHLPKDLELPRSQGIALKGGLGLVVSRTHVSFQEFEVAKIDNGRIVEADGDHMVPGLFRVLEEQVEKSKAVAEAAGDTWDEPLVFVAEPETSFSTIVDLMYTAQRAGVLRFGFVVVPKNYGLELVPIESPPGSSGPGFHGMNAPDQRDQEAPPDPPPSAAPGGGPALTIEIAEGGYYTVGMSQVQLGVRATHPIADLGPLEVAAESLRREYPGSRRIVVSAHSAVTLQQLLTAITTARGQGCLGDRVDCLGAQVLIVSDGAHDFQAGRELRPGDEEGLLLGMTRDEFREKFPNAYLGDEDEGGEGIMGIGNTGVIGKGNAGGTGSGYGRGRSDPSPRVRLAKAQVEGDLDREALNRTMRRHIGELKSCYEAGLRKDPELGGRIAISFVINKSGKVRSSAVATNTVAAQDELVAKCVAKAIEGWTFPKPGDGGEVSVEYPFTFTPS